MGSRRVAIEGKGFNIEWEVPLKGRGLILSGVGAALERKRLNIERESDVGSGPKF